jgi:hypothetical protein
MSPGLCSTICRNPHFDHVFLQVSLDPTAAVAFLALPAFKESAVLEAAQGYRVIQVSVPLVVVF